MNKDDRRTTFSYSHAKNFHWVSDDGIDTAYADLFDVYDAVSIIEADDPEVFAGAIDGGFAAEDGEDYIVDIVGGGEWGFAGLVET